MGGGSQLRGAQTRKWRRALKACASVKNLRHALSAANPKPVHLRSTRMNTGDSTLPPQHIGGRFWRPPIVLPVTLPAYFFFAAFLAAFFAGFFATAFLVAIVFYSPFVDSTPARDSLQLTNV